MTIPFLDLKRQYHNHREELDATMQEVVANTAFVGGATLSRFEEAFAHALGVKHCIGVGNGTDAIYIALRMLGIGPGDEVITAANTWISTSETITQTGAKVVFADVEADHFTIDPADIERKVTPRTKAVIPVHFHGNVADMDAIGDLCQRHGLLMVEDCAQAHFAQFKGRYVGTFGNAATFSFYPGKNLGAYGDGGAVVTHDDALVEKMLRFARHGALNKYDHTIEGINSRLDAIQAAVLNVKLRHIQNWTETRRSNAALYGRLLQDVTQVKLPLERKGCRHVYHLYVIRCLEERDRLMAHLQSKGISCMLHYPVMLPLLEAYSHLSHTSSDFPAAFVHQQQILSLPMFPELREDEIRTVCDAIREFYS
jgi:dTDP-4-amino-4,6-dideoxygalactose transaminase